MNRVAAIQKSSRTRQSAWTCSPSHCRSAATSSVSPLAAAGEEPLLELVEDQEHLAARGQPVAAPEDRQTASTRPAVGGQVGERPAKAAQQPRLRSPRRVAST